MSLPLPAVAHPGLPLAPTSTHAPGPGTHTFASQIVSSLSGHPILLLPSHAAAAAPAPASEKHSSKPIVSVPRLLPSSTHAVIPSSCVSNKNTLPRVGDVVLARVTRVRVRQVDVGILCVGVGDGAGEKKTREGNVTTTTTTSSTAATTGRRGGGDGGGGRAEGVGTEKQDDNDEKKEGEAGGSGTSYAVNADSYPGIIRREDVRATEKEKVITSEGFRVGDLVRAVVISLGDQANYYLSTARNEFGVLMARSEDGNPMVPVSWKEFRDEVTGRREERKVAKPF